MAKKKSISTKKAAAKKKGAAPKAQEPAKKPAKKPNTAILSAEERFIETQRLAFLMAEKDAFSRNPTHYWLDAEAELAKI